MLNQFVHNILSRHLNTMPVVHPRLTGRFESPVFSTSNEPLAEANNIYQISNSINTNNRNSNIDVSKTTDNGQITKEPLHFNTIKNETGNDGEEKTSIGHDFVGKKRESENKESLSLIDENTKQVENWKSNSIMPNDAIGQNETTDWTNRQIRNEIPIHTKSNDHSDQIKNGEGVESLVQNNILAGSLINSSQPVYNSSLPINTLNSAQSIIKVSIGRIEVRAVNTPNQTKPTVNNSSKPKMSLEDYFKSRNSTK